MRRSRLFLVGLTAGLSGLLVLGCGGDDKPQPQQPPGDAGPDGNETPGDCSTIAFAKPLAGAKLLTTDDLDGDCSNGVQYDVEIQTSMPEGSEAILSGTESQLTATVSGGVAKFPNVTFPIGETTLSVQVGDSTCKATAKVRASCGDAPSCVISEPVISATHPKVALADNLAAPGNPLQAKIVVTTDIEEGRLVPLQVAGQTVASAVVVGGKATWPAVTLGPDGSRQVKATCTNAAGASSSDTKTFVVDQTPPDLTVTGVTDGQHFEASDSVDPSSEDVVIRVCGTTNATDALDVKQGPSPNPNNFCVGIGTSSPQCAPAKASTNKGACVDVVCPGSAPFDITATLYDEAGNPTTQTISGITCEDESPSVQIVEPVHGTGNDVTTHILAANATQARRDQDAAKPGAQYTVVACTDAAEGKGTLKVGRADGTLTAWNSTPVDAQPAQPEDGCPVGFGYVVKFTDADLPDSAVDAAGELETATRLVVDVQQAASLGTSPAVDVWVDSTPPTIAPASPSPLCGASQAEPETWTTDVELTSSTEDVVFAVTSSGARKEYAAESYAGGKLLYKDVAFEPGANEITAVAKEPSGNTNTLESPCTVQIGNPPVLTWLSPAPGQNLCATGNTLESCVPDTDEGTAGWQGELVVKVLVDGAPPTAGETVTLTWDSEELQAQVDSAGIARFHPTAIADGDGSGRTVALTASFTAEGYGTGKATVSPLVDAERPEAPTDFAATVKDRRQTTIRLDWTAGQDGSAAAHGYDIRLANAAIDAAGFDAATSVAFTGAPANPGAADGIDVRDLIVEKDYFFAIKAVDRVGNASDVAATGSATRAALNVTVIASPDAAGQDAFGFWNDGSGDLNGDGLSDLLVSPFYGNKVFGYFGAASFSPSEPLVVFQGDAGFGGSVIFAGDVDGDGIEDVAISSLNEAKVYIFKGRESWPATIEASDADYVVEGGAEYESSGFGFQLARLGDFDGDGIDDFAISAQLHDDNRGQVVIVRGSTSFPAETTVADAIGSQVIVLNGENTEDGFGTNLIGIGKFYGGSGNGIIVSAPYAAGGAGRVYAFRGGQTGTAGVISAANATHSFDGLAANSQAGLSLGLLGPVGGSYGFAIGNPFYVNAGEAIYGNAYLTAGNAATGPFSPAVSTLTCSVATDSRDGFGNVTLGGGVPGTTNYVSFVGDGAPDLVVAASREGNAAARLYIIDGRKLSSLSAIADVVEVADTIVPLPAGWVGTSSFNTLLRDVNGDGYADFAIGEYNDGIAGRVAVFW